MAKRIIIVRKKKSAVRKKEPTKPIVPKTRWRRMREKLLADAGEKGLRTTHISKALAIGGINLKSPKLHKWLNQYFTEYAIEHLKLESKGVLSERGEVYVGNMIKDTIARVEKIYETGEVENEERRSIKDRRKVHGKSPTGFERRTQNGRRN